MTKKPTVTTLQSGFNSTQTLNANFEALRDSFENTLSLDGSTPNAMEADLDLNGNSILGASVIGTSSLVVNGKLISVSNDPVFDGTVSVFGANLIAAADAAAVKTTLSLSTVASTGSYTDLSNQPSLNFASPAQGALADSALQPTGNGSGLTNLTSANLTGALPAIDGSALTGISSATTSAQVGSATAGLAAGDVGTYMWARGAGSSTAAPQFNFGSTYAGSSLYPAGFAAESSDSLSSTWYYRSTSNIGIGPTTTVARSGTWRCMGQTPAPFFDESPTVLFLRIS